MFGVRGWVGRPLRSRASSRFVPPPSLPHPPQGKHKPVWSRTIDVGDNVIVLNAGEVELTGKKWQQKYVRWHTGFAGGLHQHKAKEFHKRWPTRMIEWAVHGMLGQNNAQRKARKARLFVYPTSEHPHVAQAPTPYALLNTKKADLTGAWAQDIPQYKITFARTEPSQPGALTGWRVELEEPRVTSATDRQLKALKKTGTMARWLSEAPHPDGFIRAGYPSHGRRY